MDGTPTPQPLNPVFGKTPEMDAKENRDIAAISYVWALGLFVFLWKKDSPFVRFHAKQGIVLFILTILFWPIPVVGRFFELLVLALCVLGFLNAAQGQWKELPLIGDMATGHWSHVRQSFRDIASIVSKLWHRVRPAPKKEKTPEPNPNPQPETVIPVVPTPIVPVEPTVPVTPVSSIMQSTPPTIPSADIAAENPELSPPNPNPNPNPLPSTQP